MSATLALMAKDCGGPNLRLQVLLILATDTNFQTQSYNDFESGRFLRRAFMQFGWDIFAPVLRAPRSSWTNKEAILTARLNRQIKVYLIPDVHTPGRANGFITAFFDDHDEPMVVFNLAQRPQDDIGREVPPSECIALIHCDRLSVVPPRTHLLLSMPAWACATKP
jgi:acetyl esterase/lipase